MNAQQQQPIRVAVGRPGTEGPAARLSSLLHAHPQATIQTPLIDIHEGPDGLVLEADLPGVTEESVQIQLEDNVLSLQAQVAPPVPEGARPLHEEFRVATYQRSFILSDEVDRERISAELKNGVLRLTLPKAERARTRRIEVKSE
ncbi:Hsp20/alpha crystallin family protein [soil metagenome]